jgi:hypothetical protein
VIMTLSLLCMLELRIVRIMKRNKLVFGKMVYNITSLEV